MTTFDPLSALFSIGQTAIEKIWPDPTQRAKELRKLEELRQTGDLARLQSHVQIMTGQMGVNAKEAEHKSLFVAGWRPAVGWVGAVALATAFIPKSLVVTSLWAMQAYTMLDGCIDSPACDIATYILPPFPDLGLTDLIGILGGILGIGTMRSYDKKQRTETNEIN